MKRFFACVSFVVVTCFIASGTLFAAQKLDADTLKKKKRGWYVTGLPLINFTTDTGVGYGVRLILFNNGHDDDKGFDETPYFTQIYGQFFQTTKGWNYHELNWDQFKLFGTNLRLTASLFYDKNTSAHYFGTGGKVTKHHLRDANFQTHKTYAHMEDTFMKKYDSVLYLPNEPYFWYSKFNYKYNQYIYVKPGGKIDLSGPIWRDLKFLFGFQVSNYAIHRWDGKSYDVNTDQDWWALKPRAYSPTRLNIDRPEGHSGGWVNFIRLGLVYDKLDFEPDPLKGYRVDYCFETSQRFLGSDYVYYRNTFGFRGYYSFSNDWKVFNMITGALRLGYTTSAHNVPFYEMNTFAFTYNRQTGLGGNRTLRGYKADRFVAKTMTLANVELRLKVGELAFLGQRFALKLIGFSDLGNAYDEPGDPFAHPRWGDYKVDYGGGIVITWNQATVIHVYYGVSPEDSAISIDFNHAIR